MLTVILKNKQWTDVYPKKLLPKKLLKHIHKEESEMESEIYQQTNRTINELFILRFYRKTIDTGI